MLARELAHRLAVDRPGHDGVDRHAVAASAPAARRVSAISAAFDDGVVRADHAAALERRVRGDVDDPTRAAFAEQRPDARGSRGTARGG